MPVGPDLLEERRRRTEGYEAAREVFFARDARPLRRPAVDLPAVTTPAPCCPSGLIPRT